MMEVEMNCLRSIGKCLLATLGNLTGLRGILDDLWTFIDEQNIESNGEAEE